MEELSGVYVYAHDDVDIATTGLVGDLLPIKCLFTEEKNGRSAIDMTLAYDEFGKWKAVQPGNYIKVLVPVRVPPRITDNLFAEMVTTYRIKSSITKEVEVYGSSGVAEPAPLKPAGFELRYFIDRGGGTSKPVKVKKTLRAGEEVQLLEEKPDGRCKVYAASFGTGWTFMDNLELVKSDTIRQTLDGVEGVTGAVKLQYQLFQIENVQQTLRQINVTANHVFYELSRNFTTYKNDADMEAFVTINGVMDNMVTPDARFTVLTDCRESAGPVDYDQTNVAQAFLDPENGICARYGLSLLRDNYDVYALREVGSDRGYVVEYGKNMLGVDRTEDITETVTRLIPWGLDKNGDPVYLEEMYVDSPHVGDYAFPRAAYLDCSDTAVESDSMTLAQVRTELKRRADAEFETGIDLPSMSMSVQFVSLGDTEEYAQYRGLDKVYLFDRITVKDTVRMYDYSAEVVGMVYNALKKRVEKIIIGSLRKGSGVRKVATWQVPTVDGSNIRLKSISASALGVGSVPESALQNGAVTALKIAAGSITTDQLAANAVTADKIAAGAITSDFLEAGSIKTVHLAAGAVTSEKIKSGSITANEIESGTITAEQIKSGTITADSGIIAESAIGTTQIADGSITDAKIVGLTANKITAGTINAADVNIINLKADNITTGTINGKVIPVLGEDKIKDGAISGVKIVNGAVTTDKIDDGSVTAAKVVAEAITTDKLAAYAVTSNKILAGAVTTDKLDANAVTADKIAANTITANKLASDVGSSLDLSSNESINLAVKKAAEELPTVYVQYDSPAEPKDGDIWINTGGSNWADLKVKTWATVAGSEWGDYYNYKHKTRVWDGSKWEVLVDQAVILDQETRIRQTEESISLMATKKELDGKVSRTEYEQDAEAIKLRVQTVEENSGKAETVTNTAMTLDKTGIHMKTGGTFTVESGNFDVDENGNVSMNDASVNGELLNSGQPVLTARHLVVSSTQPQSPIVGTVWVKPVGAVVASFVYNNTSVVSFEKMEDSHTLTNLGSPTAASGSYTWNVSIPYKVLSPVTATRYLRMTVNGHVLFDEGLSNGAGSFTLQKSGTLTEWLGDAQTLTFTLELHFLEGSESYLHNVHRLNTGAVELNLTAATDAATGWMATEVQVYNG